MTKIYEDSRKLIEIIEGHNWNLFNTTQPERSRKPFRWDELEKKGSAKEFQFGNNYIFAPNPSEGQSLRDAYSVTKGLGPSLRVEDINDDKWSGVYIVNSTNFHAGRPVLFTRLDFNADFLVAFSPQTRDVPESDILGIDYSHVINTFEIFFRIVSPNEYGLTTPISMPFHVEDN